jgi:two-component system LytT family response regulator
MGGERDRDSIAQSTDDLMPQKALIVDDERLARNQLRERLSHFPELVVVAEADCVSEALKAVERLQPDVVFLDIQMPGESGFDFLEKSSGGFKVIFVTAFDRFAVRAFEVNALDYLMKPVSFERLAEAVRRLAAPESLRPCTNDPFDYSDYLFLAQGSSARFIKVRTIKCVLADGPYTHVFTVDGHKWTMLHPIKAWEQRLPRVQFVRTHRSCIINLDHVERVEALCRDTYQVFLRDRSEPLPISRRCAIALKNRFR